MGEPNVVQGLQGDDLAWLKSACVKVTCTDGSAGSGYFVAADQVATCAHVVRSAGVGGKVSLTLSDGSSREAQVERVDGSADVALLKVSGKPVGVTPLRLVETVGRNRPFLAWGFPGVMKGHPLLLQGTVHDPVGRDNRGASAIVLHSDMVAAGQGAPMHGFSGSPMVVDGAVVGHLRRVVIDEDAERSSAELGVVFATPAREVLRMLQGDGQPAGALGPVQPPGAAYSPPWYIPRPTAQERALGFLDQAGSPAVLHGPQQSGKSWLMAHVVNGFRVRWPHGSVVRVNLLEFGEALVDLPRLAEQLASMVVAELDGADAWFDTFAASRAAPMIRLKTMLKKHVLQRNQPTLLAIDAADAVLGRPYASDFFGGLRAWMQMASEPPWNQLRLLMAISTTPARMIDNQQQSPFNIVDPVVFGLLSEAEVGQLAMLHGLQLTEDEVQRLHALTGGHPYLVRRVLYDARTAAGGGALALDPQAEVFQAHLRSLLHFVQRQSLGGVLKALLGRPAASVTPDQEDLMKKAGLLRRSAVGGLEPTCGLYRDFFSRVL